jgi:diguanylate cyclase (GGDEF)-like protein
MVWINVKKVYFNGELNNVYDKLSNFINNITLINYNDLKNIKNSIIFFDYFSENIFEINNDSNIYSFILPKQEIKKLYPFSKSHFFYFIEIEHINDSEILNLHLNLIFRNFEILNNYRHKLEQMENKIFDLAFATTNVLQKKEEIEQIAIKDGLTHLYNHAYFKEQLNKIFNTAKRESLHFCVAILDLDFFKKVNDEFGHLAGDGVLKEFANIIQRNVRQNDIVARYGGEEFAIIFPNSNCEACNSILKRIRESINKHKFKAENKEFFVTFSAGIAEFSKKFKDIHAMLHSADQALYKSKNSGRNKTTIHYA